MAAIAGYLVLGVIKYSSTSENITISAVDFLLASPYVIILLLSLLGGNVEVTNVPPHLKRMFSLSGIDTLGVMK